MPAPINAKQVKRILLVRTDRIGDVVLTTPVFSAIRRQRPDVYLALLVSSANRNLVVGNPYLDEVIVYDKLSPQKTWWGVFKFAQMLRKKKFDAAILLHPRARNYWMCFLAGIPIRIGYQLKNHGLLTHKLRYDKPEGKKHEAEYNFDFLALVGIKEPKNLEARVMLQPEFKSQVEDFLPNNKPYVVFNPSASTNSKIWPSEYFAEVADGLVQKYQVEVVIVGGKEDIKFSHAMQAAMKNPAVDLTGKFELGALAWVFKSAKLVISNDTGPMHVAAALDVPVIAIFLRSVQGLGPGRWKPLGENSIYLLEEIVTTPEAANTGVITKDLIHVLTPEHVLKTIDEKGWLSANALKR